MAFKKFSFQLLETSSLCEIQIVKVVKSLILELDINDPSACWPVQAMDSTLRWSFGWFKLFLQIIKLLW